REAHEILRRASDAQRLAQRAARSEVGILGIGFFGTASGPILPSLVDTYRLKFPDVELRLFDLDPDQQLAAFDEGRIDLGFTRTLPSDRRAEFEQEEVYNDQLAIALPAKHPLSGRLKTPQAPGCWQICASRRTGGFVPTLVRLSE